MKLASVVVRGLSVVNGSAKFLCSFMHEFRCLLGTYCQSLCLFAQYTTVLGFRANCVGLFTSVVGKSLNSSSGSVVVQASLVLKWFFKISMLVSGMNLLLLGN